MKFQVDFYDAIAYGEVSEDLARYKKEFDLAKIPPMQRRRLSSAAKCAFSLLSSFVFGVVFSAYLTIFYHEKTILGVPIMMSIFYSSMLFAKLQKKVKEKA